MGHADPKRQWLLWASIGLVTLFALWVRWYYVISAEVIQPVYLPQTRGDAADYYRYAWNLSHYGVFSSRLPGNESPISDSFRDPGYPLLMAAWMRVFSAWEAFYAAMLLTQAALGAATVGLLMFAGRRWLGVTWLTAAGLLMAIWPHSVAASSFLLSEVLFGFLVALALTCWVEAVSRRRTWLAGAAGLAFSAAALTNAVLLPFAPAFALVLLAFRRQRKIAMVLLMASLAIPLFWTLRNTQLSTGASSGDRAVMNLVQGSWPSYHQDFKRALNGDAQAQQNMQAMDTEMAVFQAGGIHGIENLLVRLRKDPVHYLGWYLYKPALLWQWDIRISQRDIYTYYTQHSPFVDVAPMRAAWAISRAMNPFLALLALAACIWILISMSKKANDDQVAPALLALYVTFVYSLLQSEPRYSVAFRGVEILLAFLALQWLYFCVARLNSVDRGRLTKSVGMEPASR
ncbi:ArnT family glycosyltransferase [Pinirhizobacter soli]|uniref:ArnT family glycosyltransferase n=1 Tax=Pinirhizobacter soli TaxID=2786953 RepID=UPI00202A910E|nr:hypothetical protein [Pinirhizobacter soli]